jgi:co-chaperonin GroES (HSP10)
MSELPLLPVGHRILILTDELNEDGSKSQMVGSIVTSHSTDDFEREREFQEKGTVVAIGPSAYNMPHHGEPWAKIGDHVLYKKYDGKKYHDEDTGKLYRIINDEDVIATIKR